MKKQIDEKLLEAEKLDEECRVSVHQLISFLFRFCDRLRLILF